MDNTFIDWTNQFIKYCKQLGYPFDYKGYVSAATWNIENYVTKCLYPRKIIGEICEMDDFWLTMKPFRGAIPVIKKLNDLYDIRIATTPWREDNKYYTTKIEWLRTNMPFLTRNQIEFSGKKWELEGDIIIEDKPDTLEICDKAGFLTLKCNQPYNMNTMADDDFYRWSSVPTKVKKLVKLKERM